MAHTMIMAAVLVVSFVLMFGLVKFSEIIITRQEPVEPGESAAEDSTANHSPGMSICSE